MTIQRNSKAAAIVVGSLGLAVLTSGTAYAYWTANGTGAAAAQAATVQGVEAVLDTASPSVGATLLYPGGPNVAARVTVVNPNTSIPVKVTAVQIGAVGQPTKVTGGSGCTPANSAVSLEPASLPGLSRVINGGESATFDVPAAVAMGTASNTGCQGATFIFGTKQNPASGITVTAQVG